jgi:hypothetical protein
MPSSVIQAMRYDPAREQLLIVFRGGRGIYRYSNVPMEEWDAFLEADSKGTYLNEVFKRKGHPYQRLAEPIPPVAQAETSSPLEWGETWSLRKGVRRVEAVKGEEKVRA